jgi:hypothetical protein
VNGGTFQPLTVQSSHSVPEWVLELAHQQQPIDLPGKAGQAVDFCLTLGGAEATKK